MTNDRNTRLYLYVLGIVILLAFAIVMLMDGEQIKALVGLVSVLLGLAIKNLPPSGSDEI